MTMKIDSVKHIKICSDLHLDNDHANGNDIWTPVETDIDHETLLIVAGDIWHNGLFIKNGNTSWIDEISNQFMYVVIVLGNHDYWGLNLAAHRDFKKQISEMGLENVFLLEDDIVYNDEIKIIGSTLWTSFDNNSPITKSLYDCRMNDGGYIKDENGLTITSDDIFKIHDKSYCYIFDNTWRDNPNQKVIVVTHHAPSPQSGDIRFKGDLLNGCFYSDLEEDIICMDIDFWIHGHLHSISDYFIGNTRVLCNPRGYNKEHSDFDENLYLDI